MGFRRTGFFLLLAFATVLLCVRPVFAGLGGDGASVAADSAELRGSLHVSPAAAFEIQEISAQNGIRVREFLNQSGLVFAVAWSGPVEPNLQQLLGVHFAAYHAARAAQKPPGLHRDLRLALPDLVVESGGHMRAYRGRAYLPTHLPTGVSAADLQ
jgi:hypothetical protein